MEHDTTNLEDQNIKAEQATKLTDKALEELATAFEQGKRETLIHRIKPTRFRACSFSAASSTDRSTEVGSPL